MQQGLHVFDAAHISSIRYRQQCLRSIWAKKKREKVRFAKLRLR